jgi:hypothetical protein
MTEEVSKLTQLAIFEDPEAIFQEGWLLCDVGAHDKGMPFLERGIDRGYLASPVCEARAAIRSAPAERRRSSRLAGRRSPPVARALDAFRGAGGERLLGRVSTER